MAIAFVVEDGTGLSNSTSYLSVEDFRQFWENRGKDYSLIAGYTDAQIQVALNNATSWLHYSFRYIGTIFSETQALDFPRVCVWDRNDIDVSKSVPADIAAATAFLGQYEVIGNNLDEIIVQGIKE